MTAADRVVAIVLAAGAASRFGTPKMLAQLDGRPVLAHVVDGLTAAGIRRVVVVLGPSADEIEARMVWPDDVVLARNPRPEDGLSTSLRIGVAAALRTADRPAALLVALGDQPRVGPDVIGALLAAAWRGDAGGGGDAPARPVVVPRYADGSNPNPVVLLPAAWALVDETSGDRGLGPVLAGHPDLVLEVPVAGTNPDVDVPEDLQRLRRATGALP